MSTYIDLFSGIGGFALALQDISQPRLYCDIEQTLSCTLHMGDTVKPPDGFDPACFRLLNKTAELVSKTSLTSLTVFCRQQDTVSLLRVSTSSDRYSEASSCNFLPPAAGTAIPSQSTSQVQFYPFTPADSTCLCV